MKNGVVVRAGTFKEASQSDLVIFTGSDDDPEEDRDKKLLDLHEEIGSIASKMSPMRADIKMIIACCDEVDFLVQSVQNCFSGVSPSRIFRFGAATLATVPTNFWITKMNKSKRIVSSGIYFIGGEDDVVHVWDSEAVIMTKRMNLWKMPWHCKSLKRDLIILALKLKKTITPYSYHYHIAGLRINGKYI